MSQEIYLDNNATTRPLEEVRQVILRKLGEEFGNPSSAHTVGDRARGDLREARHRVAELLGSESSRIIFTGSGTEANNLVLLSAFARAQCRRSRIVITNTEHSSVLKMVEHLGHLGIEVVIVPVAHDGLVAVEMLDRAITSDTSLVSVHWVNNETGVIQPIEEIGGLCEARGVPLHTDACQAVGKLRINVNELPVDLLTLTAHKIHGPQGVGAIYAREPGWLSPLLRGGPQENGLRAGTENLPGIVGLGESARIRQQHFSRILEKLGWLRDRFERRVLELVPDVSINGNVEYRVCNTTNMCFKRVDGQALVARLDQEGICCSQSSACTNQRPEPSYVLRAMGLSEDDAYSSVRFSFGVFNTEKDVESVAVTIRDICSQLRGFAARLHNPYHSART